MFSIVVEGRIKILYLSNEEEAFAKYRKLARLFPFKYVRLYEEIGYEALSLVHESNVYVKEVFVNPYRSLRK